MKARRMGPARWTQLDSANWPTHEKRPVAVIDIEPDEIQRVHGLVFKDDRDDLDALKIAVVRLDSGAVVGLLRYANAPTPGTGVYIDAAGDPDTSVREIMQAFDIPPHAISWSRARSVE